MSRPKIEVLGDYATAVKHMPRAKNLMAKVEKYRRSRNLAFHQQIMRGISSDLRYIHCKATRTENWIKIKVNVGGPPWLATIPLTQGGPVNGPFTVQHDIVMGLQARFFFRDIAEPTPDASASVVGYRDSVMYGGNLITRIGGENVTDIGSVTLFRSTGGKFKKKAGPFLDQLATGVNDEVYTDLDPIYNAYDQDTQQLYGYMLVTESGTPDKYTPYIIRRDFTTDDARANFVVTQGPQFDATQNQLQWPYSPGDDSFYQATFVQYTDMWIGEVYSQSAGPATRNVTQVVIKHDTPALLPIGNWSGDADKSTYNNGFLQVHGKSPNVWGYQDAKFKEDPYTFLYEPTEPIDFRVGPRYDVTNAGGTIIKPELTSDVAFTKTPLELFDGPVADIDLDFFYIDFWLMEERGWVEDNMFKDINVYGVAVSTGNANDGVVVWQYTTDGGFEQVFRTPKLPVGGQITAVRPILSPIGYDILYLDTAAPGDPPAPGYVWYNIQTKQKRKIRLPDLPLDRFFINRAVCPLRKFQ